MPIPKPRDGESEQDFMGRCMGDSTMKNDFPDNNQRVAVCMTAWNRKSEDKREQREK